MIETATTIINQDQALTLIDKTIQQSEADGVFVSLSSGEESLSRFSENQISQNISNTRFNLSITSYFGRKSASSSTTELIPEAITATLRRSEELARFAPDNPEWMPLLKPQVYSDRLPAFDEETATLSPLRRGEMLASVCEKSTKAGVEGSGTLSTEAFLVAVGNSEGLRACDRTTEADFSFTAKIGNGSAWGNRTAFAMNQIPIETLSEALIARSHFSQSPREISPGIYPVILDNAAFAGLLPYLIWNLDARAADEGRSFMSSTEGNRLGEAMFSPLVRVQRNPAHPLLQSRRFFGDGLSNNSLDIITDGIPQTLAYSRYWASQQGKEPTGGFFPIVMTGTNQSLEDLIGQMERGILVSRSWYVRNVNPKTLVVTGMTRDGTFWIENGKIAYPIKNLRFNQSLPEMLRDVEAVSQEQRFNSSVVPGVRLKAFNFSSVTDSI